MDWMKTGWMKTELTGPTMTHSCFTRVCMVVTTSYLMSGPILSDFDHYWTLRLSVKYLMESSIQKDWQILQIILTGDIYAKNMPDILLSMFVNVLQSGRSCRHNFLAESYRYICIIFYSGIKLLSLEIFHSNRITIYMPYIMCTHSA